MALKRTLDVSIVIGKVLFSLRMFSTLITTPLYMSLLDLYVIYEYVSDLGSVRLLSKYLIISFLKSIICRSLSFL